MSNIKKKKGVIAILTGGGDVPGLNPAIRGVTIRAIREGFDVIGLRRGWAEIVSGCRRAGSAAERSFYSRTYRILPGRDNAQNRSDRHRQKASLRRSDERWYR